MLDIVAMRYCKSLDNWVAEVEGSKGDTYTVSYGHLYGRASETMGYTHGWTCTCRNFTHRLKSVGECKHIKLAKAHHCGWHEQYGSGQTPAAPDPKVRVLTPPSYDPEEDTLEPCPCCGGATRSQMCGV